VAGRRPRSRRQRHRRALGVGCRQEDRCLWSRRATGARAARAGRRPSRGCPGYGCGGESRAPGCRFGTPGRVAVAVGLEVKQQDQRELDDGQAGASALGGHQRRRCHGRGPHALPPPLMRSYVKGSRKTANPANLELTCSPQTQHRPSPTSWGRRQINGRRRGQSVSLGGTKARPRPRRRNRVRPGRRDE